MPALLIRKVLSGFSHERNNHLLSPFNHAVRLGVGCAGGDVLNVVRVGQDFYFFVEIFRSFVRHQSAWASKVRKELL